MLGWDITYHSDVRSQDKGPQNNCVLLISQPIHFKEISVIPQMHAEQQTCWAQGIRPMLKKKKKKNSEHNPRVWFLINYLMHVGLRLTLYAKCIQIFLWKAAAFEPDTTGRTPESWRRREKPVIFWQRSLPDDILQRAIRTPRPSVNAVSETT